VDIYRDAYGIPHLRYLLTIILCPGYVHAQDAFWQMDFWRHLGSGRLAEMFGEGGWRRPVPAHLGWARVVEKGARGD